MPRPMSRLGLSKEIFNHIQALKMMQDRLEATIKKIQEKRESETYSHNNFWVLRPADWPAKAEWCDLQRDWAAETLDWENEIRATRAQINSVESDIQRLREADAAGTLKSLKEFELPFDQHIKGKDKCVSED